MALDLRLFFRLQTTCTTACMAARDRSSQKTRRDLLLNSALHRLMNRKLELKKMMICQDEELLQHRALDYLGSITAYWKDRLYRSHCQRVWRLLLRLDELTCSKCILSQTRITCSLLMHTRTKAMKASVRYRLTAYATFTRLTLFLNHLHVQFLCESAGEGGGESQMYMTSSWKVTRKSQSSTAKRQTR